MSDFIIVVEVCNKRALAAYTKGLESLNLIWPQLAVHAARMDLKADEQYRILDAHVKKVQAEARLRSRDLDYDLPRHREPSPIVREDRVMKFRGSEYIQNAYIARYKSIYDDLKHMADVAGVALGPYRITGAQVSEMIGWESGTRIQELKAECAGSAP